MGLGTSSEALQRLLPYSASKNLRTEKFQLQKPDKLMQHIIDLVTTILFVVFIPFSVVGLKKCVANQNRSRTSPVFSSKFHGTKLFSPKFYVLSESKQETPFFNLSLLLTSFFFC